MKRLLALYNGEELTQSETQTRLFDNMKRAGILLPATQHGTRTTFKAVSTERLRKYLAEELNIQDLRNLYDMQSKGDGDGTGDDVPEPILEARTAKTSPAEGFYVTSVEPLDAQVGGAHFTINPPRGICIYIYDYKIFSVPRDVLIVGVESVETFRRIRSYMHMFPKRKILFVHRHARGAELAKWLKATGNTYIHFADFDLVSIFNFQSDIYSKVGEQATFLVPPNISELIDRGNRKLYDAQKEIYRNQPITDMRLKPVVELINARHRCYAPSKSAR